MTADSDSRRAQRPSRKHLKKKKKPSAVEIDGTEPAIRCSYSKLEDPRKLKPNPQNPNKHTMEQIALLAKIIKFQGWRSSIVVSKRSGMVVTGHGRLEVALFLKVKEVPVDYQDFTPDEEKAHLLADNKVADLAEMDFEQVSALLKEIKLEDMTLTGFRDFEIEPLLQAIWSPPKPDNSSSAGGAQTSHIVLTHEQRKTIDRAIAKLKKLKNADDLSDGEALEQVCKLFLK